MRMEKREKMDGQAGTKTVTKSDSDSETGIDEEDLSDRTTDTDKRWAMRHSRTVLRMKSETCSMAPAAYLSSSSPSQRERACAVFFSALDTCCKRVEIHTKFNLLSFPMILERNHADLECFTFYAKCELRQCSRAVKKIQDDNIRKPSVIQKLKRFIFHYSEQISGQSPAHSSRK